jgi:hypothetical protein
MTNEKLQRYDYYSGPRSLGTLWTARRGALEMRCALSTHRLGWDLRLTAGANALRSLVARSEAEVHATSEAWRQEAAGKGWTVDAPGP